MVGLRAQGQGAGPDSLSDDWGREEVVHAGCFLSPTLDSSESEAIPGGLFLLPTQREYPNLLHPSGRYSLPPPGSILWPLQRPPEPLFAACLD